MNCRTASKHLDAYADGELAERLVAPVSEHLRSCPSCAREMRWIGLIDRTSSSIETPPVSERQWEDCWKHIQARIETVPPRLRKPSIWSWTPVAAAALIVIGVIGYLLVGRNAPPPTAAGPSGATATLVRELRPGLTEVNAVETGSASYIPSVLSDDNGNPVVWITEIHPTI